MTRKQAVAILNDFIEYCPDEDWEQTLQIAKNSCEKLEKIEQIVNEWNNDASHSFSDMCKLNKILKE